MTSSHRLVVANKTIHATFPDKLFIGFDGDVGTGKSTLSRLLNIKISGSHVLTLDECRSESAKNIYTLKTEDDFYKYLLTYYDQQLIIEKIKSIDSTIVICDGCFLKTLYIPFIKYVYLPGTMATRETNRTRLHQIYPNANAAQINVHMEQWYKIVQCYVEKFSITIKDS